MRHFRTEDAAEASSVRRDDYAAQNLTGYQVRPALVVRISSPWMAGFPVTKLATVGLMNSSEVLISRLGRPQLDV